MSEEIQVPKRLSCKQRREEMKLMFKEIGVANLRKVDLSKKFGVSRQMIKKDYLALAKFIDPDEIKQIRLSIYYMWMKATDIVQEQLRTAKTQEEINAAIRNLATISEHFINMLESFGLKEKIADKVESLNVNIGLTQEQLQEWFLRWKQKQKAMIESPVTS